MRNACLAEKPRLGQKIGRRRIRRRKSLVSPSGVGQKWPLLRRRASGSHVDYNARLYDPAIGRFLSTDPLIAHPGSTQAINPYSYVENNPLNKTDPTGMAPASGGSCDGQGSDFCNTNLGNANNVTIAPGKGTVTVNMKDGTSKTVNVGKAAASLTAAGAVSRFGVSVISKNSIGNTNVSKHNFKNGSGSSPKADGKTTKDSPGRVSPDDTLSAIAAQLHYMYGKGETLYTGVNQLHLDQVPLGDFPKLGKLLNQASTGKLAEGTYKISDKAGWSPPGLNNKATFGRITVMASGILTVRSNGYSFEGRMTALSDRYDFNWSWGFHDGRSPLGEASTVYGWLRGRAAHLLWGGGNPYQIKFVGTVAIKENYP